VCRLVNKVWLTLVSSVLIIVNKVQLCHSDFSFLTKHLIFINSYNNILHDKMKHEEKNVFSSSVPVQIQITVLLAIKNFTSYSS